LVPHISGQNLFNKFDSDLISFSSSDADARPVDNQRFQILILIFALSTFLTHSVFLFPVKFQTNLHRLATHLGQWRLQAFIRTDTINEWSSECNAYTHGSVVKLSSNNEKYFIAKQNLSNAAHPQSISHSILYRLFSDARYLLTIQFIICMVLIVCQLVWVIQGKYWHEIIISTLIILNSSYTIFKIIRDRLIFDMIDDNEYEKSY
jgi:hypothetical protein